MIVKTTKIISERLRSFLTSKTTLLALMLVFAVAANAQVVGGMLPGDDFDGDSVPNLTDSDDDNDGILDTIENAGSVPLLSGFEVLYSANGTSSLPTGSKAIVRNALTFAGISYHAIVEVTGTGGLGGGSVIVTSGNNLALKDVIPTNNPYFTYALKFVSSVGFVDANYQNTTPVTGATIPKVTVILADIDGSSNYAEVSGYKSDPTIIQAPVVGSELVYVTNVMSPTYGGFQWGTTGQGGPGATAYNYYRPIDATATDGGDAVGANDQTNWITITYDSFTIGEYVFGNSGKGTGLRGEGGPSMFMGNIDFTDIDGDGIDNSFDLDSDGDGCSDSNEAYSNSTYAAPGQQFQQTGGAVAPITPTDSFNPVSDGKVFLPAATYATTTAQYKPAVTVTTVNAPANFDLNLGDTAASFTVSGTGTSGGESFTWERSLNGLSNWTPVVNGEVVNGATFTISFGTETLDITGIVGSTLDNSFYRAVMTDAVNLVCGPITSGHARLGLPTPPNPLPIAVDNDYSILEDTTVTLTPLAGDSDPTNEPLTLVSIGGTNLTPGVAQSIVVANGIVNITAAGVITFTPTLNYFNTPTTRVVIPYVITDGTSNATANQNIEVRPDNDPPVADDEIIIADEDLLFTSTESVLDGDTDIDSATLTVVAGTFTTANGGSLVLAADGSYTYKSALNYNGQDTVNYTVTDGNKTDIGTLTITVNPQPDAPDAKDDTYITAEDVAVILNPLALDTDVDGDALTIVSINGTTLTPGTAQTIAVTNGTIDITAAGVITFTPTLHFTSPPALSIPYVISDGTLTDTANQLITVVANIPPVANHVTASTLKDTNVDIQVASAATDVDGTINIATIDLDPTTPSIETTWTVDGEGTYTANANGTVTFDPLPTFGGAATPVNFTIQDNTGEVSNIATIKVTVNLDSDGDGVLDPIEDLDGTDPNNACDSLEDHATLDRTAAFLNADCDGDGVTNAEEFGNNNLIPFDSNGNGEPDYLEINNYKLSNSEDDIEVFNAVSPASDDIKNNVFTIRNIEKYPDNSVQIYNRWGVVVYEASGYGQGDNFFRGVSEGRSTITASAELPVDTYFYVLKYVNSNGDTKERTGYLYINR